MEAFLTKTIEQVKKGNSILESFALPETNKIDFLLREYKNINSVIDNLNQLFDEANKPDDKIFLALYNQTLSAVPDFVNLISSLSKTSNDILKFLLAYQIAMLDEPAYQNEFFIFKEQDPRKIGVDEAIKVFLIEFSKHDESYTTQMIESAKIAFSEPSV